MQPKHPQFVGEVAHRRGAGKKFSSGQRLGERCWLLKQGGRESTADPSLWSPSRAAARRSYRKGMWGKETNALENT